MKLIIAGGRTYTLNENDMKALDALLPEITEIVSGGATGADTAGEIWATSHGIPFKRFPANWAKYGKAAGPMRNQQMARYADAVILFPGGRGTQSMHGFAVSAGLRIIDRRREEKI